MTISYFPSCSAGLDPERFNFGTLFYEAVGDDPVRKVAAEDVSCRGGISNERAR